MRRRDFLGLLGGAAVALPRASRAQQAERMRRIGVLINTAADDPEGQARNTAFVQALRQFGWSDERNGRIETRWSTDAGSASRHASTNADFTIRLLVMPVPPSSQQSTNFQADLLGGGYRQAR